MKLTRRKTILGMGLLAGGSGATLSSAAFATTTNPGADLRVISDGRVTVRGNASDGDVYDLDENSSEDIDFENFNRDDLPRATFANTPDSDGTNGNINGDIDLTVGVELGEDGQFDSILKIDNETSVSQNVAIHFEENEGAEGENETYGEDVESGDVSKEIVQEIYEFYADTNGDGDFDTLISPESGEDGVASGDSVDHGNTAANQVTIADGETLDIALDFFTDDGDIISDINSAAAGGGENPPFGRGGGEDVDLLDAIVVGVEESS